MAGPSIVSPVIRNIDETSLSQRIPHFSRLIEFLMGVSENVRVQVYARIVISRRQPAIRNGLERLNADLEHATPEVKTRLVEAFNVTPRGQLRFFLQQPLETMLAAADEEESLR